MITDGKQTKNRGRYEDLFVASTGLKATGVIIYSMGIGKSVDTKELAAMATDPQHVFSVSSFEDLQRIVNDIKKEVCKGNISRLIICLTKF